MKRNNEALVYVAAIIAIVLLVFMYFLFVAPGAPFGDDVFRYLPYTYLEPNCTCNPV